MLKIIKTFDPEEFAPLDAVLKDARIVGVGEGAHFVSEFARTRIALIRFLIERHGFNAIALECGELQALRLSRWLDSPSDDPLEQSTDLLTVSLYGTVLLWLKAYLRQKNKPIRLLGIDLPNTLSPGEDLTALAEATGAIDPALQPSVDRLTALLSPVQGGSAVNASAQWGRIEPALQDEAAGILVRIRLRLKALAPLLEHDRLQKVQQRVRTIEYTLQTLRIMKSLFEGTALEGDTSVRDYFMAETIDHAAQTHPQAKIILLAHNNHIQKAPVSFAGELTALPMGVYLAKHAYYRAIAQTHTGPSVPEMDFPAPKSPLGFSVVIAPADEMRPQSIEALVLNGRKTEDSCLVLIDGAVQATRIRSQSASVQTDLNKAFDAVVCAPCATQDGLG